MRVAALGGTDKMGVRWPGRPREPKPLSSFVRGSGFSPVARVAPGRGEGCLRVHRALFPLPRSPKLDRWRQSSRAREAGAAPSSRQQSEAELLASHPDGRLWLAACHLVATANQTGGGPPPAHTGTADGAKSFVELQLFEERIVASLRAALWPRHPARRG